MKTLNKLSALLSVFLALSVLAAGCSSSQGNSPVAPRVGAIAPDFTLPLLEGNTVKLSDLRGRPVLINFWASWCGPCRYEMPFLQAVNEKMKDQGLMVLGVNLDESKSTVSNFMKELKLDFPIALDSGNVARAYQIDPIPATFLVDRNGVIRFKKIGAFSGEAEIKAALKAIL